MGGFPRNYCQTRMMIEEVEEGVKGKECNESLAANMVWGAFTTTSALDKSNEEEGRKGFQLLSWSRGGEHKRVTQPMKLRARGVGSDKRKVGGHLWNYRSNKDDSTILEKGD